MSKRSKKQDIPENLKWEGEKNLKFLAKRHDKRFGDISVFTNKRTNQKVMCKEKASGDMKQFGRDVNTARQRMSMQNQYLHKMLGWSTQTKKELCSTHHYVKMFYEYPGSDLRNETAQRKKNSTKMTESELSNATSNALNGLDYLHSKKLAHGDIRPQLISANRMNSGQEANKFELLDRLADPSPLTKCQINNMMNNKELFMSPQLWKSINTKGKKKPPFNRQKNDLFALGMSVLSAGNQTSMKKCYKKGGKFDAAELNKQLKNFGDNYGHNKSLTNVVSSLVTLDETQRPTTNLMLQRGPDFGAEEFVEKTFETTNEADVPFEQHQFNNKTVHTETVVHTENVVNTRNENFVNQQQHQNENFVNQHVQHEEVYEQPNKNFHRKQANMVSQEVENANKQQVQTQQVVAGDDFFNNPAPTYEAYQPTTNYVQAEKVEPVVYEQQPQVVNQYETQEVVYQQPQTNYVQSQPQTTYVQSQPQTTYVQPQTTYVQSEPQTTYVQSQPQTTYVQSTPQTTYVQSQPQTTYVESTPQTTYVQSTPNTTTYVENTTVSSPSFVQTTSMKSDHRPSQTTTMTDGSNVTYGTPRVVRKYVDHSSRRSFRGGEEVPVSNFQVRNEAHVEKIVSSQPTTTYVQSQPQTTTTYVESSPQTTYVQSTPQTTTTYVDSNPRTTTTYVESAPQTTTTYVESSPQTMYNMSKKKSTTFQDAQFGEVQSNGNNYVQGESYSNLQPASTTEGYVSKKKVIVRDGDGNIIEEYEEDVQ